MTEFRQGDLVIYLKQKSSISPGPRAQMTNPSAKGDTYNYAVEKYWIVEKVREDGTLCLRTRRGKQHEVKADDPRLRKPNRWERWFLASRFPSREPLQHDPSDRKTTES